MTETDKKPGRSKSIGLQLIGYLTGVFCIALLALAVYADYSVKREYVSRLDMQLTDWIGMLEAAIVTDMKQGNMAKVGSALSDIAGISKVKTVFLADIKGRPKLRAGAGNAAVSVPEEVIKEAEKTGRIVSKIRLNKGAGGYTAEVYRPVKNEESCRRCHNDVGKFRGFMALYIDAGWMENDIRQARNRLILSGFTLLALLAGIILWLANRLITRPLLRIRDFAAKIASGDYTVRDRIEASNEIGDLSESLDKMADAIQTNELELKRSHDQLVQSEKMSAVGQLAAGVAHEINNPLGIILGFAQSVTRRLKENDPLSLPLKTIEREAVRCKNLVQNLLVFSRTSKSAQFSELDLNDVVESALSLISAKTKMCDVELTRELGAGLPQIQANSTQLQQILINLAGNAIDAMSKGGTLTVSTSLSGRPGYVELRVRDTGAGISKELQKKIFEPFFTTKEIGKGTGLGLSLVYEIVTKHGGAVEVESEEGKGTEFTVSLPVHPAAAPAAGAAL